MNQDNPNNKNNASSLPQPDETYWRRKLSAYMHDNPDKASDIRFHELNSLKHKLTDQFQADEYFDKSADFDASAADRLPFPDWKQFTSKFDGVDSPFKHPLGNSDHTAALKIPLDAPINTEIAHEDASDTRVILDEGEARAQFITRWRYWRQWASEKNPAFAFMPADTRIPDHTIWHHLSISTALQGCIDIDPQSKPSLILFSVGPVQPLIAAARNIRDLWSGSYLLSYLVGTALGEISKKLGPDHIIFPSAWGQPVIDMMLSDIYGEASINKNELGSIWDENYRDNSRARQQYLLPSLPNRFLALVPADHAKDWGDHLKTTIQDTLVNIGIEISKQIDPQIGQQKAIEENMWIPERIETQLRKSLECTWQTFDFPETIEKAVEIGEAYLPPEPKDNEVTSPNSAVASIERLQEMWAATPKQHQTSYGLKRTASAWPILNALVSWLHDAVKQSRAFPAWETPYAQTQNQDKKEEKAQARGNKTNNKDTLTGKEEYVLLTPDNENACKSLSKRIGAENPYLFKPNEAIGALTLVKRLWHIYWLCNDNAHQHGVGFKPKQDFEMPDLHQLSQGDAYGNDADGNENDDTGQNENPGYFAVIAFDGDEMGKWVSGAKMPKVRNQIAKEALEYYEKRIKETDPDTAETIKDFLDGHRPLNPSFHLQFSETLGHFSLYATRRIVEAHQGRLIYAGGDDVLAVVPANQAITCASALRSAFQGNAEETNQIKGAYKGEDFHQDISLFEASSKRPGTLQLHPQLKKDGYALHSEPHGYDFPVPGPAVECSVGIAMAHYKSPLQDVVRAAQDAEKRAKSKHGREAVAIDLIKRSGETIQWGCQWKSGGLEAYSGLTKLMAKQTLSGRYPYRFVQLVQPYEMDKDAAHTEPQPFDDLEQLTEVLRKEASVAVDQNAGKNKDSNEIEASFVSPFQTYLENLRKAAEEEKKRAKENDEPPASSSQEILQAAMGLHQTAAFASRNQTAKTTPNS